MLAVPLRAREAMAVSGSADLALPSAPWVCCQAISFDLALIGANSPADWRPEAVPGI